MAEPGGVRGAPGDGSDMFSVDRPSAMLGQLPKKLPPSPDELRQKRRIRIALAITAILLVALAIFLVLRHRFQVARDEAANRALEDGLVSSSEAALELASSSEDDESRTVRSLLLAIAALERGTPAAPARALVEELGRAGGDSIDPKIAAVYLALEAGELDAAATGAAALSGRVSGARVAEVARARALVAQAIGDLPRAVEQARAAAVAREGSPRHGSLLAILAARAGDVAGARTLLSAIRDGDGNPAVRIARARVALEVGDAGGDSTARREADAVLTQLGRDAPPPLVGWAHLVRARTALGRDDIRETLAEARAARASRPPADGIFDVTLAEVLFRAGAADEAGREIERWTGARSTDRGRRAAIRTELALAAGRIDAAAAALAEATPGPRTELLRGRLAEARGELDAARAAYRTAAGDRALLVEAYRRLGALELGARRPAEAIAVLDAALAASPSDPSVVPLAVDAHLARRDVARATALVTAALAAKGERPELLVSRADVEMASARWTEAVATMRRVVAARAEDAGAHAQLGEALLEAGSRDDARASFDRALALDRDEPRALVGTLRLAVDAADVPRASELLAAVERVHAEGLAVDVARARLAVMRGEGDAALDATRRAAIRNGNDPEIWVAVGNLAMQADRVPDAATAYGRAIRTDAGHVEALVGRGLVYEANAARQPASKSLDDAEEAAAARAPTPRVRARIFFARGRVALMGNNGAGAVRLARLALREDPRSAEAHLLLADVEEERGRNPATELRAALAAVPQIPEVWSRLAASLETGAEACSLARRYVRAAPRGVDADRMRALAGACPPAAPAPAPAPATP